MRLLLSTFLLLIFSTAANAYIIKGRLGNVASCFYPKAYLAVINDIDDIYTASPEHIIAIANIDEDGNFTISGNDLPDDKRFYRLYVNKDSNTNASIYTPPHKNYVVLIMDNAANIAVSFADFCMAGASCEITGSPESKAAISYQNIVSDYAAFLVANHKTMSSYKRSFADSRFREDLMHFADTSRFALAGLLAVAEIGINKSNDSLLPFFRAFSGRLKKEAPSSLYTSQYGKKLETFWGQKSVQVNSDKTTLLVVSLLLACSVLLNIILLRRKVTPAVSEPVETKADEVDYHLLIEALSIKEREILKLVNEGLSNKEIAQRLNVELSTVKTHVSRIYQKTGIQNRRQVASIARYL